MKQPLQRRTVIKGGLAAGIGLAVPGRLLAEEAAATAASVSPATPYERRILEVAASQIQRVGAKVWRGDLVGVADFAQPSWKPRLHFANLEAGTVRSFLLAHGRGSDPAHSGWLQRFSNVPGSEATSRGAFLTCEWYKGKYGTSIRLKGLDADNSLALERAIVMHPAWYVDQTMIDKWGKLGRSEGCFAMSNENFNEALWHLSGGRLLFADRIGEA
ncbi:murein L,D-transpeptidase catalytic domain-containing protein [Novosphingobium beihaiensis]|uniref:Murein L,D-transpeptidase catalytic domain family protein n=1 Tax=Novosphingobium beihaiensis TaxID=2930389 RepID=A0ABT0BSH8_9SPHN|nr:murein L,D-transpeptidase catalytic domain family protein [Novosphingobium beihaiensis]MCJ2188002.1 murein L,D-transpeptidase catalytic domain family protein [Novosphingobium beihaiensis]